MVLQGIKTGDVDVVVAGVVGKKDVVAYTIVDGVAVNEIRSDFLLMVLNFC